MNIKNTIYRLEIIGISLFILIIWSTLMWKFGYSMGVCSVQDNKILEISQ